MRIGIDISQLAYSNTGVANLLKNLVNTLTEEGKNHEFILFYSSLRRPFNNEWIISRPNVSIKQFKLPPSLLDLLWNRLHILPVEYFIGEVDLFISSDWTEPPTKNAQKVTILYDLVVLKYPQESTEKIVDTQKRKLHWVQKETEKILCISESTLHDARELLHIQPDKLSVVYPGLTA